ncbi:hypothetical protein SIN8267_02163 [Sinobacterium norvegicum]|uniref:Fungal lipase-type domain-containing protein n=1 Tax=Sinobacterium norvegicum TaxID=1641715 RepID=A0ABN8EK40_9GAMM|nr:lipase family protein [Sinobacterium norvegicum]CAH0992048.1 hypothetical protein SIN8267_02163 [Sinobacterium norvegicum]
MSTLTPHYAATLASDIYAIKSELSRDVFLAIYENEFDVNFEKSSKRLSGSTGCFIKEQHVMGIAALGKDKYSGQAFVALKGTAGLFDALTDLNAGLKPSHNGGYVHQGFYYTFASILPDLQAFVRDCSGQRIHTIHCVGHSLGGALATLTADWLSTQLACTVKLYTFGSPRTGLEFFAAKASSRLGSSNIHRVYHKTDPVPMVPTWPFVHVPNNDSDYLLNSRVSPLPWEFHKMDNYMTSTRSKDWMTLKTHRPKSYMDITIERWLKSDSFVALGINSIELVGAALLYVVKKVTNGLGIILVSGFSTTFTILDRLAYLMSKAVNYSKELSRWVILLIKRLGKMFGIIVTDTTKFTASFIRSIFLRLHSDIGHLIRKTGQALF